ncbi:MAG TPA: FAD-dependent monooxygenase [Burkholderiaceae bacterium]|nr:FAD-dependent monooxygenase [Burkholderiaceae bacterium]
MSRSSPLRVAVIGAGPVGLALALLAARRLPAAQVSLFDARAAGQDASGDPRMLALSLGSVQLLERLGAWDGSQAEPIAQVHVSQQPAVVAAPAWLGAPEVSLKAADLAVPMLGAVLSYGALVAPLQRAWDAQAAAEPGRLATRFGTPVAALKDLDGGVEVDAGVAESFDLAVIAEGGVFGDRRQALADVTSDYRQDAWIGTVMQEGAPRGVAIERFTRHGPAALLPLPGGGRAALVWCVPRDDDPVRDLDDAQRAAVLNTVFDARAGRIVGVSPLKRFPLGLAAQRSLVRGRQVRIGNAAQTLHPVAGQGLNLGLRDAWTLAAALRDASDRSVRAPSLDAALARVAWQRAPDRWALIAATDFLARSFTWDAPGIDTLRGAGLALLDKLPWAKNALARQMMFGSR